MLHIQKQYTVKTVSAIRYPKKKHTSARNTSKANPLKQLITACWTSKSRLSKALMVESKRPGLREQNMWILTVRPSLTRTSTCKIQLTKYYKLKKNPQSYFMHLLHASNYKTRWIKLTFGWVLGLSKELGQSSSLTRQGRVDGVGVNGWKLVEAGSKEPGGADSSSLWRSLILCRSSFK